MNEDIEGKPQLSGILFSFCSAYYFTNKYVHQRNNTMLDGLVTHIQQRKKENKTTAVRYDKFL